MIGTDGIAYRHALLVELMRKTKGARDAQLEPILAALSPAERGVLQGMVDARAAEKDRQWPSPRYRQPRAEPAGARWRS